MPSRPSTIRRHGDLLFVGERGPPAHLYGLIPDMGCAVTIATTGGVVLDRLGGPLPGSGPGRFVASHGMAVAPDGTLYVAEVTSAYLQMLGLPTPAAQGLPCLRRWSRS